MMKKLIVFGLGLTIAMPAMAQKVSDVKKLEALKEKKIKTVEAATTHFNQDMSSKFACFPDYQMPFETLAQKAVDRAEIAKNAIETTFEFLLSGSGNNGLKDQIAQFNKYKELKRKERNRLKKKSLKKIIEEKKKQINDLATLIRDDSSEGYQQLIKETVTLDGTLNFAMNIDATNVSAINIFKQSERLGSADGRRIRDIYNQEISALMESCQTASCVYLISSDIKQWMKDTLKLNEKVKIISGKTIKSLRAYSNKKIFKQLDVLTNEIASRKPIGDLSDECQPAPAPAPVPGDDDGSNDDGSIDNDGFNDDLEG